jgi:hypothetical protein
MFNDFIVGILFALAFGCFMLAVFGLTPIKNPGYMGLVFISVALVIREFRERNKPK